MKNKAIAVILMLLACVPVIFKHATGDLLKDSDTNFLVYKLNQYNDPLRWFTHDWPLENHFYRPISTLVFEFDNRIHPGDGNAFGLTNAIICSLCILATGWFATEAKRSLTVGVIAAWLASFWTLGGWFFGTWWATITEIAPFVISLAIAFGMIANRAFNWKLTATALASFFLFASLSNIGVNMSSHTMYWLPGRTATVMTVFTMVCLAAYIRFERLGAPIINDTVASATDEPATRTSSQSGPQQNKWGWFVVSCICCALALGSYEQAVMLPFVIFVLGLWLRIEKTQTRFAFQLAFWMLLLGYILLRMKFIPVEPSKYQAQQFRTGSGLWIDLLNYGFPSLLGLKNAWIAITTGLVMLLTPTFWTPVIAFVSNVSFWVIIRNKAKLCALILSAVILAYLPMGFLKQFGHYHYWPSMILTVFVITVFESYWPTLVNAVSPQVFQAPKRLDRAPGSLPHL